MFTVVTPFVGGEGASFDPLGIIWTNLVDVHQEMLPTKFSFFCSYVPICDPRGGASFDPRGITCTNLVDVN